MGVPGELYRLQTPLKGSRFVKLRALLASAWCLCFLWLSGARAEAQTLHTSVTSMRPLAAVQRQTPPPPPTVTLKAWTSIQSKSVHSNATERIVVHTQPGASIAMTAVYPDKVSAFSAKGKAGTKGVWSVSWSVVALQKGRANVRIVLRLGDQKKVLNRHFQVI
jgi:hypothetical protein